MERDEAIAPLSRDHHGSLLLAQLLKKNAPLYRGMPVGILKKATYAQQQFEEHINDHFSREEAMLKMTKGIHEAIDLLTGEIITEHRQLVSLFRSLDTSTDPETDMDTLATALESHIRKEERMLFPLLQQHCSKDLLQNIHELLH
jgi:hemerythrin-like domain-containing protein